MKSCLHKIAAFTLSLVMIACLVPSFSVGAEEECFPLSAEEFARKVDGSTVTINLTWGFARNLFGQDAKSVTHTQTVSALNKLIAGECDIVFTTYPSQAEFDAAEAAGITLECVPIVNDAFVFLVNDDNPVKNLNQELIRGIYSGSIEQGWYELAERQFTLDYLAEHGETPSEDMVNEFVADKFEDLDLIDGYKSLTAYQRNSDSGSQSGLIDFMGVTSIITPMEEQLIYAMSFMIDRLSNEYNGIGYSYYYYAKNQYPAEKHEVNHLAVDGVYPNNDTIRSGEYPLITPYYAVIRSDESEDGFAKSLLSYALSEQGQAVAETVGYVGAVGFGDLPHIELPIVELPENNSEKEPLVFALCLIGCTVIGIGVGLTVVLLVRKRKRKV